MHFVHAPIGDINYLAEIHTRLDPANILKKSQTKTRFDQKRNKQSFLLKIFSESRESSTRTAHACMSKRRLEIQPHTR